MQQSRTHDRILTRRVKPVDFKHVRGGVVGGAGRALKEDLKSGKADLKLRKPEINPTIHIVSPALRIAQGLTRMCKVKISPDYLLPIAPESS
jgi:hypothetical protein